MAEPSSRPLWPAITASPAERVIDGGPARPGADHGEARGQAPLWHGVVRVLVVDDNPADADLQAMRLMEAEAQVSVQQCARLDAALALLATTAVDAVVLDLGLPDASGDEGVRRIRERHSELPLIAVSGGVRPGLREQVLLAGGDELYSKDEANSRLFWRGVLQIVEHRRAQQQQLRRLLDCMPDGVLVMGEGGVVRYVNRAAVALFGRNRDELIGQALHFSVRDGDTSEIVIRHPDGERVCELRVVPLFWNEEAAQVANIRDVTQARQAARLRLETEALQVEHRRLEAASRAKNAFVANMSHELRTPLNAVIGLAQLIRLGANGSAFPKLPQYADQILDSGRHLLAMIEGVLDLAKVEAGRLEFRPVPLQPGELATAVVELLQPLARDKNLQLLCDLSLAPERVCLDPTRLRQVLLNLLSNALKFTPEGGRVELLVQADGDHRLRLEVRDTGIGIAASDLPRLFTEFTQLHRPGVGRPAGTGLGLALTRRIVEEQGGQVTVDSEPGLGTSFVVLLPQVHVVVPPAAPAPTPPPDGPGAPRP